jgi:hypothetical protein
MAGSLIVRGSVVLGMAAAAFSVWVGGVAPREALIPRASAAGRLRLGREIEEFERLRKAYQDLSYEGLVEQKTVTLYISFFQRKTVTLYISFFQIACYVENKRARGGIGGRSGRRRS